MTGSTACYNAPKDETEWIIIHVKSISGWHDKNWLVVPKKEEEKTREKDLSF